MEFDSPDVMKDFPGLYATELNKKCKDESDFSDDTVKNDLLIGKKKDKKDKESGYAALEGESSCDENTKSRSPKYKKSKTFKFTSSKSKEKRDKSREKDEIERKKDKDRKQDKKIDKERGKVDKHKKAKSCDETASIADVLPIFGVSLDLSVERSKCHDGINIPLLVRQCLEYLETVGLSFEGIYKVSGAKSRIIQLKKGFNNRENIDLFDYDVPTCTSLLKLFVRELPEPIFTNDLLVRFEEAGAILSTNTREKHLKILLDNLPPLNKLLLSWLLTHFNNVSQNEKLNKMSSNHLGASLSHAFRVTTKLLTLLIQHSKSLFPDLVLVSYIPPLPTGASLPTNEYEIKIELAKQESLLNQIHMEMNSGCIIKQREELLWEVQRIITQLKRKIKMFQKESILNNEKIDVVNNIIENLNSLEKNDEQNIQDPFKFKNAEEWPPTTSINEKDIPKPVISKQISQIDHNFDQKLYQTNEICNKFKNVEESSDEQDNKRLLSLDKAILLTKIKNKGLLKLRENLMKAIQVEQEEIDYLEMQLMNKKIFSPIVQHNDHLDKIMNLLQKENQILHIKKINLVRQIIEQQEVCVDLQAKIEFYDNQNLYKIM